MQMNARVGGLNGNFAGNPAGLTTYAENSSSPDGHARRGLSSADNTRTSFLTDVPA